MTKQNRANSSTIYSAMFLHSRTTALPPHSDMKRKPTNLGVRYSSFFSYPYSYSRASSSAYGVTGCFQHLVTLSHFTVLRTADFRNCKAAYEIRAKIKLIENEYNEMIVEMNKAGRDQDGKQQKESLLEKSANKDMLGSSLLEGKHITPGCPDQSAGKNPLPLRAVKRSRSGSLPGSYIVGGSASGWNFITYGGNKPRYYGVTKKSFRKKKKEASNC